MREGEQVRSITESIRVRGYANSSKRSELAVEFSDNVLQVATPSRAVFVFGFVFVLVLVLERSECSLCFTGRSTHQ